MLTTSRVRPWEWCVNNIILKLSYIYKKHSGKQLLCHTNTITNKIKDKGNLKYDGMDRKLKNRTPKVWSSTSESSTKFTGCYICQSPMKYWINKQVRKSFVSNINGKTEDYEIIWENEDKPNNNMGTWIQIGVKKLWKCNDEERNYIKRILRTDN
jgi:hypothetical protein